MLFKCFAISNEPLKFPIYLPLYCRGVGGLYLFCFLYGDNHSPEKKEKIGKKISKKNPKIEKSEKNSF